MKKLMIAASAALCATVGFSSIESSNIVGYMAKEAGSDLNWYAPTFVQLGANTVDINDIILDDGMASGEGSVGWGETMQIVGPLGNATEMYAFYCQMLDPTGTVESPFYWGDGDGNPVKVSFDLGDGVGIDNGSAAEFSIRNAGEVYTDDISFEARADLNWTGNPYPTKIDINAVTLDDGMASGEGSVGWGETMQIVGPLGNATEMYAFYCQMLDPTGTVETPFYWGDGDGNPVKVELDPGAGFAIDNGSGAEFKIKIASPIAR